MKPDAWVERLFLPVDAASVVIFRVAFGLVMAWDQLHYVLGGRLDYRYLQPLFLFKYPGFQWVERGDEAFMKLVFWALFALALAIAAGVWYRLAAAAFFLGYLYVFLLDAASYNNHNYLVCLLAFVLIFIPAHRPPTVPAWGLWLLRFNIALPYFFGGLAKLNHDWLARAQPMRLWLTTGGVEESHRIALLQKPWAAYFFSWGGLLFDLAIVPLLLVGRTRPAAFVVAVGFHLNNVFMFDIGFFPWLMIGATTIFFPPDWPRRLGLMRKPAKKAPPKGKKAKPPETRPNRLAVAALAAYVGVHLVLPMRHLAIPGNVDWTEEGHRFAWRMKLRDKRGDIRFTVVDKATRRARVFDDHESILTSRQRLHMTQDPDMIRQFARVLGDKMRERGSGDIEIRAQTMLSLNGREAQPLIDPEVDLAAASPTWGRADWIVPLEN